jgi:hypothetical protein
MQEEKYEYIDWPVNVKVIIIPKKKTKLQDDIKLIFMEDFHASISTCKKQKIKKNVITATDFIKMKLDEGYDFFLEDELINVLQKKSPLGRFKDSIKGFFESDNLHKIMYDFRKYRYKHISNHRVHYVDVRDRKLFDGFTQNILADVNFDYKKYYNLI